MATPVARRGKAAIFTSRWSIKGRHCRTGLLIAIPARRNDNMSDEAAARASVLRNALDSYFKAIAARDPSRLALVFAEDGEFEDPVGTPVIKGRDTMAGLFASNMALASDVEIN